ncbi:hypothetical protein SmJEL517_g03383 [Synchytrium microbalum]|uniref:Vacuolar protein sorting-associated protein 51 homolog n=1 Tax=Synchytrium microbalum TaxID=1806994 RepID=A0A507BYN2_9FUNG|nr:uncharacterized protein SmJEL517_g03383 [Synchytrium microbalum]TPX33917.1 hypothetical protein SmJEL517_g03383 [Synchytrium microbalum]
MAEEGPSTQKGPRKARNLLKNFYGLAASEQAKKRPDPLDIGKLLYLIIFFVNSTAFHPEVFLNKALHEQNLVELIQRDNDMVSEIKDLDGQMKTLVCENYNKFISATDSIRKMKTNVENMESEMDRLSKSMDQITQASTKINDSLADRRSKIHQLSGVHTLLKKLNFVFELPTRLKQCLNKQQYAQAVQYHSQTAHLLVHYRHIAVFKKIEDECKVVMDEVGKKIRDKMHRDSSTTGDIVESFGLLIGLATQQPQDLAKEYLQIFQKQFTKSKNTALKHLSTMQLNPQQTTKTEGESPTKSSSSSAAIDLAVAKVSHLDSTLLAEFALLVKSFEDYFLLPRLDSAPLEREESPSRPVFFAKLSSETRDSIRKEFTDMVEKATSDYFAIVEGFLPSLDSAAPTAALAVFDKLHSDVSNTEALKRTAHMDERVQLLTMGWLGKVIGDVFARVKQGFFDKLKDIKPFENSLDTLVQDAEIWVEKTLIDECLPVLESFITPESGFVKTSQQGFNDFMQQVRKSLAELWFGMQAHMMELTSTKTHFAKVPSSPSNPPVLSLILARVSKDFAASTVDSVYQSYAERLFQPNNNEERPSPTRKGASSRDKRLAVVTGGRAVVVGQDEAVEEMNSKAREICNMWKETSQKLLSLYVEVAGMGHGMAVRRHFAVHIWLDASEPSRPSSIWDRILSDLQSSNRDVLQLYDDEGVLERKEGGQFSNSGRRTSARPGHSRNASMATGNSNYPYMHPAASNSSFNKSSGMHRSQSTLPSPTHQNTFDQLMSGIDKLFSERVEYFGLVDGSHSGILMGIVKVLVKSFIEEVRMVTLNKAGFRQTQLDTEYLRMNLWQYAQDDRLLFTLLDEVMASAYRRCTEPTAFEREALEPLLSVHK